MIYSILIYGEEGAFGQLSGPEQGRAMEKHRGLQQKLRDSMKLGPVARLLGTSTAVTLRERGGVPVVIDGPFAETKEHLLGFYLVECASIEEAIETAKQLPLGFAAMEVRPVDWFDLGVVAPAADG